MSLNANSLGVLRQSVQLGALLPAEGVNLTAAARTLGAAYAWLGDSLPEVGAATGNWVDVVGGVVATATGAPTVGVLNGRKAALFAGAQYYQTAAFAAAIAQPYAIVSVFSRADTDSVGRVLFDGLVNFQAQIYTFGVTFRSVIGGDRSLFVYTPNTNYVFSITVTTPLVTWSAAPQTAGTYVPGTLFSVTGATIGAAGDLARPFIGPIAAVVIFPAASVANAATFAELAKRYYRI